MKIRSGLALLLATALGVAGCASGGGGSSSGAAASIPTTPGAETLAQGERPRQDENTRAAQRAMDAADDAADDATAMAAYRQARTAAEAAIATDSTNPLAWRLAGEASLGMEDFVTADEFLTRAEELRPIYSFETEGIRERAWIGLYQEAVPLVNGGQYEDAAGLFEQANAIYDQRPEVMITLGQIYAQLREHDKAIENLDRAVAIINSDKALEMDSATVAQWRDQAATIPVTRAQVLADAGRTEEAVAAFRQLAAENPTELLYRRNLATLLVQMGNEAEAFEVYDELMEMPGLASADYYQIGVGYYTGSDYERSARAFRRAAEESPRDRDAIEMWARSLQIDSVYADIPPVAERWIELDPNNANALLILAQASQQNGDTERAGDVVRQIEKLTVNVNDLQLTRHAGGGASVTGSLTNKLLDQGAQVTLDFTFYDAAGNAIGTAAHTVTAPATDMSEVFRVEFTSDQAVGGYGYTVR